MKIDTVSTPIKVKKEHSAMSVNKALDLGDIWLAWELLSRLPACALVLGTFKTSWMTSRYEETRCLEATEVVIYFLVLR